MKIFIENETCNLNYEGKYITYQLEKHYEITKNPAEADIIILAGTCSCSEKNIVYQIDNIMQIAERKKDGAKLFVTGCITREFNNVQPLSNIHKFLNEKADYVIPKNQPNLLLKLISNDIFGDLRDDEFGFLEQISPNYANLYVTNGCLNNCSFCKTTYQKNPLKSCELDEFKAAIDVLNEKKIPNICIKGMNICQYGLDIEQKYLLPEIIEYLETKENIKNVSLIGFAFKDAIKGNFQDVIKNSTKIKTISGSLESGSNRLLELMRKGFTSEQIIYFVNEIREKEYKRLVLNIISGFPTETIDDIKTTLEVLKILIPEKVAINRYGNHRFIDSSQYEQLPESTLQEHTRIYNKVLKKRNIQTLVVNH